MRNLKYWVYILRSLKDGSYYIGQTNDVLKRLEHHNKKKSKYSSAKVPWELIYKEEFTSRSESMKREKEIKNKKKRSYIDNLIRTGSSAG